MTAELFLDAVDAYCAAATPEPWRFLNDPSNTVVADAGRSLGAFSGGPFTVGGTYNYDDPQNDDNATFIAAARTDLPRLAAFARAVLALCDWAEADMAAHPEAGPVDWAEVRTSAIRAAAAEHLADDDG